MKIEKGSGADKFWTGIIGIFLLLELIYIIKLIPYLNPGVFNFIEPSWYGWYLITILCGLLGSIIIGLLLTGGDMEYWSKEPTYYMISFFILLDLPFLITLLPIIGIMYLGNLLYKKLTGKVVLLFYRINSWANDRF